MKVIDLIIDYSKGKELPKKIKVDGMEFVNDGYLSYKRQAFDKEEFLFTDDYNWGGLLNYEVEIIEEDKKIEKLEIEKIYSCDDYQQIYINFKNTWNKINEIIDKLEN